MKIILPEKPIADDTHRHRGTDAGHEQRSAEAIRRANEEPLRKMDQCIKAFRQGDMQLPVLVSELEYHLHTMAATDYAWQEKFFCHWRVMDHQLGRMVRRGENTLTERAMEKLSAGLEALQQLVAGKLTSSGQH